MDTVDVWSRERQTKWMDGETAYCTQDCRDVQEWKEEMDNESLIKLHNSRSLPG